MRSKALPNRRCGLSRCTKVIQPGYGQGSNDPKRLFGDAAGGCKLADDALAALRPGPGMAASCVLRGNASFSDSSVK